MADPVQHVLYDVERSARYHARRQAFLDGCHKWIMFAIIVAGTFTFASFGEEAGGAEAAVALVAPVLGALDLVFGLSHKARDHGWLYRSFMDLVADLQDPERLTETEAHDLRVRFVRLCGEEPPIFHVVNAACQNEVIDSHGLKATGKIKIPLAYRLVMHLHRFPSFEMR